LVAKEKQDIDDDMIYDDDSFECSEEEERCRNALISDDAFKKNMAFQGRNILQRDSANEINMWRQFLTLLN